MYSDRVGSTNLATWAFPVRTLSGEGAVQQIGLEAHRLGGSRALIIADPSVISSKLIDPVTTALESAGIVTSLFTDIRENPIERNVHAGVAMLRAKHADLLVAVGGGSVLDAAKLIRMRAFPGVHDQPLIDYDEVIDGGRHISSHMPAMIAIPTTAGTGSEVSRSAVITLEANRRKTVIFSPYLQPNVAILDPEMTVALSPRLTATTGFDALSHCIEAYLALGDHPLCDAIALGGIRLIRLHLRQVYQNPTHIQARSAMQKAAMMGGVAMQKGLGAGQALAHPLANDQGIQQGLAKALCLPAVLRFNASTSQGRLATIAEVFGESTSIQGLIDGLMQLRSDVGLPDGLGAVGVTEAMLDTLATKAAEDASLRANPRPCSQHDLLAMYQSSL